MSSACCLGDKDSHGGSILEGSSATTIGGKPAAYLGASVSSDGRKGHNSKKITDAGTSGATLVLSGSRPLAAAGGKVSCGASLLAAGSSTTIG